MLARSPVKRSEPSNLQLQLTSPLTNTKCRRDRHGCPPKKGRGRRVGADAREPTLSGKSRLAQENHLTDYLLPSYPSNAQIPGSLAVEVGRGSATIRVDTELTEDWINLSLRSATEGNVLGKYTPP